MSEEKIGEQVVLRLFKKREELYKNCISDMAGELVRHSNSSFFRRSEESTIEYFETKWGLREPKLIKTWEELFALPPSEKYMIVDLDGHGCNGWIVPIEETDETEENYFDHHVYLSTHTFYGSCYQRSTEILQKYGFNVEIDNWDKKEEK